MYISSKTSRREFLALAAASALLPAPALGQQRINGKERLIVRSLRPEDLETPVELLNSFITPNDLFYVRHHLPAPQTDANGWKLEVGGLVDRPGSISLEEIKRLPKASVTVTLECAGNGRAFFDPPVAGIQWEKGAIGTARWTGARLADILKKAGIKTTAKYILLDGADRSFAKVPDFVRNLPVEKALHADTIIAYEMNGVPIPRLNGFPLRAIVPGWEGAYSVKWLERIAALDAEFDGFFVKTGYRYPTKRIAPGSAVDPKDMAPLTGLVVKSLITAPKDKSTVKAGVVRVSGFAWAGEDDIGKVDISIDGGSSWVPASLGSERERYAWRQFTHDLKLNAPGYYTVMARATDEKGRIQPLEPMWNPSGYLWNAIDRVRLNVEAA